MNCVWSSEPTLSRNGTEPSGTVKYCSVQHTPSVEQEADALDVRPCVGTPTPSTCTG
ncbi:hypothetical protein CC80DRAFT_498437 [Byssothecium circinans]|uniref:Uncharacterized protein n=1 Tax=Byssothecium circinans TaxID=147558 RepID=A0A6A5T634_9PLEO|nr:hypothetical protein CC80DRAFT_498437 [Byssothecium circinans]